MQERYDSSSTSDVRCETQRCFGRGARILARLRIVGQRTTIGLLALAIAASCRPVDEGPKPLAHVLSEGAELALVASPLDTSEATRYLAGHSKLSLRFYADPSLLEYGQVGSYSLWIRGIDGWRRAATVSAESPVLEHSFVEGIHPLRASVLYADGREDPVPLPASQPHTVVYVDTVAPEVSWAAPLIPEVAGRSESAADASAGNVSVGNVSVGNASVGDGSAGGNSDRNDGSVATAPGSGGTDAETEDADRDVATELDIASNRVILRWSARDALLASRPVEIDWSVDGAEWVELARVDPVAGPGEYEWTLPDGLPASLTLRLRAFDTVGRTGEALLPLRFVGPLVYAGEEGDVVVVRDRDDAPGATTNGGTDNDPGDADEAVATGEAVPTDEEATAEVADSGGRPTEDANDDVDGEGEATGLVTASAGADGEADVASGTGPSVDGVEPPDGGSAAAAVSRETDRARPAVTMTASGECFASRETVEERWTLDRPEAFSDGAVVTLSISGPGAGVPWREVARGSLPLGLMAWETPAEAGEYRLRLSTQYADGSDVHLTENRRFVVDATAPTIRLVNPSSLVGGSARFAFEIDPAGDGGGAAGSDASSAAEGGEPCVGLERLRVFLRGEGKPFWDELSAERVELVDGHVALDLRFHAEGSYEMQLAATDVVGNEGAEPGQTTPPLAKFRLDRTPPRISGRGLVLDWVGGFDGEAVVDFDAGDCEPPIIVDGREGTTEFRELSRIDSLALPQGKVRFDVPADVDEFEVRVSVRDKAGNVAEVPFGPRRVAPPIRLLGFGEGMSFVERAEQRIEWEVHSLARRFSDELQIAVEHQAAPGGQWSEVSAGLAPEKTFYWEIPSADEEDHRLRLVLYRRGEEISKVVSPPFRILDIGGAADRDGVDIAPASLAALEEARIVAARFLSAEPTTPAADLESLSLEAEKKFQAAIALDRRNYHATYGLAQFLRSRIDLGRGAADVDETVVTQWLEATVEIAPEHAVALNDLGADYVRSGEHAKAERVLRRSVDLKESARGRYNLGLALLYGGKARDALAELTRAEELAGPDAGDFLVDVHFYAILAYVESGDLAGGREALAKWRGGFPPSIQEDLDKRLQ